MKVNTHSRSLFICICLALLNILWLNYSLFGLFFFIVWLRMYFKSEITERDIKIIAVLLFISIPILILYKLFVIADTAAIWFLFIIIILTVQRLLYLKDRKLEW